MTSNSISLSGSSAPAGRRWPRVALVVTMLLLFTALLFAPVPPSAQTPSVTQCPVFYKELGKRLSSLPRDAGRKARLRDW